VPRNENGGIENRRLASQRRKAKAAASKASVAWRMAWQRRAAPSNAHCEASKRENETYRSVAAKHLLSAAKAASAKKAGVCNHRRRKSMKKESSALKKERQLKEKIESKRSGGINGENNSANGAIIMAIMAKNNGSVACGIEMKRHENQRK
jgi:hypothetical protein